MERPDEQPDPQVIDHLAALENPRDDQQLIDLANGLESLLPHLPQSAQGRLHGLATKLSTALFHILPAVQALKKGAEVSNEWLPAITNAVSILNDVCHTLEQVIPFLPIDEATKAQLQAAVALTSAVVDNAQVGVLVASHASKAITLAVQAYTKLCSFAQHVVRVTAKALALDKQQADAQGQAETQQEKEQEEERMEEETQDKGKEKERN